MVSMLRCLKCLATEPVKDASNLPYSLSEPEEPAAPPVQPDDLDDDGSRSCTFFMLSADFVRQFPGKSLPFFQEIRQKYPEALVEVTITYTEVVHGMHNVVSGQF